MPRPLSGHTKVMAGSCARPDDVRPNPSLGSYYYIPHCHTGVRVLPNLDLLAAYRFPPSVYCQPQDSHDTPAMYRFPRPMFTPGTSIGPVVGVDHCRLATSVLIRSHWVVIWTCRMVGRRKGREVFEGTHHFYPILSAQNPPVREP